VANPRIVDYYAVLAAYTRLSDELVRRSHVDDTANAALERLNEAYDVLANPESRRQYDEVMFQTEIEILQRQQEKEDRRRWLIRASIFAALSSIVVLQSAVLVWMGWDYIDTGVQKILGPLWPDVVF
jgi:Flp pilus assembly protein TadB